VCRQPQCLVGWLWTCLPALITAERAAGNEMCPTTVRLSSSWLACWLLMPEAVSSTLLLTDIFLPLLSKCSEAVAAVEGTVIMPAGESAETYIFLGVMMPCCNLRLKLLHFFYFAMLVVDGCLVHVLCCALHAAVGFVWQQAKARAKGDNRMSYAPCAPSNCRPVPRRRS